MKSIRVILVDDHAIVRQGLRVLLESESDLAVVGEAETGRQALSLVRDIQPDVVVMDIAMPGLNGMESTRQIAQNFSCHQSPGVVHV
jgi:two-component system, NarL family, response regulator LiaR